MEPIIVTAFWDVGRGNNCSIPRSNERYYKEFEAWARIKNRMIIFTDAKSEEHIRKIRKNYGLEEVTTIIVTPDIYAIQNDIYIKMKKIEKIDSVSFKFYKDAMSNRADFDYAWFMKYWCLSEAAKMVDKNGLLAWMDFGFNHLNSCFDQMEQFDFLWNCNDIDLNKIHLYSLCDVNNINLIDTLIFQNDTIMGVFHLVPAQLGESLWQMVKKAMETLITMGCIDDDQMLLLIAYKNNPDMFEIHISNWFLPLKENGGYHLHVKQNKQTFSVKQIIKKYKARYENLLDYSRRLKKAGH